MLGITEIARLANCTLGYVYTMAKMGKFAGAVKVDGQWRVPRAAVEQYVKERKERASVKLAA